MIFCEQMADILGNGLPPGKSPPPLSSPTWVQLTFPGGLGMQKHEPGHTQGARNPRGSGYPPTFGSSPENMPPRPPPHTPDKPNRTRIDSDGFRKEGPPRPRVPCPLGTPSTCSTHGHEPVKKHGHWSGPRLSCN